MSEGPKKPAGRGGPGGARGPGGSGAARTPFRGGPKSGPGGGAKRPWTAKPPADGAERRIARPHDGSKKAWTPRPSGDGDKRPYRPREGGDAEKRPFRPREGVDPERKPYRPRAEGEGEKRPYRPREGGDADRKPYRPRPEGDADKRPFRPREGGGGDTRPYRPRAEEGGEKRPFRPRPEGEGEQRPFRPREGGDADRKPYRPRPEGEGDKRPFRARTERAGGDDRPRRDGPAPDRERGERGRYGRREDGPRDDFRDLEALEQAEANGGREPPKRAPRPARPPAEPDPHGRPTVALKPGEERRLLMGAPWAFSNEIDMTREAKEIAPGEVVRLVRGDGEAIGLATFNPHPLIAARIITPKIKVEIDAAFIAERVTRALAIRERLFDAPFYRLMHAEADGVPGLVIDRYNDVVVIQANTAGAERMTPHVIDALEAALSPRAIVLRNDAPSRLLEGLEENVEVARGALDGPVEVHENGATWKVDLVGGQKTGWFFDHRANRAFVAGLCGGGRVLDVYSYLGGFGVLAAKRGATRVDLIDRSSAALALAARAASENGVGDRITTTREDGFDALTARAADEAIAPYDVVICDPPAFAKSRKDLAVSIKAYRKLARLAAMNVAPGGFVALASCSHAVDMRAFQYACARGLWDAGRAGRMIHADGAGPDHPVHPFLPETAYLKCLVYALD